MESPSTLSIDEIEETFRLLRLETEEERAALEFDILQAVAPAFEITYTTNAEGASVVSGAKCQTSAKSSTKQ
jgi:hypothetical protein